MIMEDITSLREGDMIVHSKSGRTYEVKNVVGLTRSGTLVVLQVKKENGDGLINIYIDDISMHQYAKYSKRCFNFRRMLR